MVINRENVIEKLKQESERAERERRLGMASANNFSYYLEEYLRSNRYWKEFIASKMKGEWKVKDLANDLISISVIYLREDDACISIHKRIREPAYLTAILQGEERPKDWWLSEDFPVKELTMIDEVGIRYRPQAIQEELEDLKVNKKTIDQRIKSLKEELKKLTV